MILRGGARSAHYSGKKNESFEFSKRGKWNYTTGGWEALGSRNKALYNVYNNWNDNLCKLYALPMSERASRHDFRT